MRPIVQGGIDMEWIFIDLAVGSLALFAAQLLDYMMELSRAWQGISHLGAFTTGVPPGDTRPPTEDSVWYDQAA
jgi:hypothetical protein